MCCVSKTVLRYTNSSEPSDVSKVGTINFPFVSWWHEPWLGGSAGWSIVPYLHQKVTGLIPVRERTGDNHSTFLPHIDVPVCLFLSLSLPSLSNSVSLSLPLSLPLSPKSMQTYLLVRIFKKRYRHWDTKTLSNLLKGALLVVGKTKNSTVQSISLFKNSLWQVRINECGS